MCCTTNMSKSYSVQKQWNSNMHKLAYASWPLLWVVSIRLINVNSVLWQHQQCSINSKVFSKWLLGRSWLSFVSMITLERACHWSRGAEQKWLKNAGSTGYVLCAKHLWKVRRNDNLSYEFSVPKFYSFASMYSNCQKVNCKPSQITWTWLAFWVEIQILVQKASKHDHDTDSQQRFNFKKSTLRKPQSLVK